MEEEKKNKIQTKMLIIPLLSVGLFLVLIFGAGYAYFTSTITNATATYQVNMPTATSLVCTKTDCSVTVTPAMMLPSANSNTAAKTNNTCAVSCTCSGSAGAKCSYIVNLTAVTAYSPTANLGSQKEFTVQTRLGSNCSAASSSTTETQVNTQAGKTVATCVQTIPANGASVTDVVNADFRWYNVNLDQTSAHQGKTYKYTLSTITNSTSIG